MEDSAVSLWAIVTIGGPIILGLAGAYAILRNRRWWALATRRGHRG